MSTTVFAIPSGAVVCALATISMVATFAIYSARANVSQWYRTRRSSSAEYDVEAAYYDYELQNRDSTVEPIQSAVLPSIPSIFVTLVEPAIPSFSQGCTRPLGPPDYWKGRLILEKSIVAEPELLHVAWASHFVPSTVESKPLPTNGNAVVHASESGWFDIGAASHHPPMFVVEDEEEDYENAYGGLDIPEISHVRVPVSAHLDAEVEVEVPVTNAVEAILPPSSEHISQPQRRQAIRISSSFESTSRNYSRPLSFESTIAPNFSRPRKSICFEQQPSHRQSRAILGDVSNNLQRKLKHASASKLASFEVYRDVEDTPPFVVL